MSINDTLLNLLHKLDKDCPFIQAIIYAISEFLKEAADKINDIYLNFFFDSLTLSGILYFEKLLAITPLESQTLDDRRSKIQAKWLSNSHNDIVLIQRVCDAWKNGEVEVGFVNGKIQINFVGGLGVPADLESLKKSIDEIKPAYIPYEMYFKYLLKKNIHHVLTKSEMETYLKSQYCNVGD